MDTIVYLLIFLIVITISIYTYSVYIDKTIEYFQNTPASSASTNNYVESDRFPNLTTTTYIELPYYSTIRGIQNEFVTFITDYKNFRGEIDRNNSDVNYTYTEDGKEFKDIKISVLLLNTEKTIGYRSGDIGGGYALLYSGGYVRSGENYVFSIPNNLGYGDTYSGRLNLTETKSPSLFNTNYNKFKQFVNENSDYITSRFFRNTPIYAYNSLKNKLNPANKNFYNFRDNFTKSFWNPTGEYFPIGRYDLKADGAPHNIGEFLGEFPSRNTDIDRATLEKLRVYIYGSITTTQSNDLKDSAFYGSLFNFSNVNTISLYLRIPYYSSNFNGIDLQYSHGLFSNDVTPKPYPLYYLYDPDTDRTEPESYVDWTAFNAARVFASATIGGALLFESYATGRLAMPEIFKRTRNSFKQGAIQYNDSIFNLLNLNNNTLTFPPSSDPRYVEGNSISGAIPLSNLDVKQQFVGKLNPKIVAKMPPMLRRYITSWSYNRTLRTLQRRLESLDTNQKFYFLMGLALNNYFYSNSINDLEGAKKWKSVLSINGNSNGMTDDPDDAFGPERDGGVDGSVIWSAGPDGTLRTGMGYGLVYSYFNIPSAQTITYGINDGNTWVHAAYVNSQMFYDNSPGRQPYTHRARNLWRYKTVPPTITADLVNELNTLFITSIQKLIPDYGIPLNVLDPIVLDKIAQHFYELSDGLHEITYIYDVFRVGSNMLDIRFDKKQRLDSSTYLTLRNTYYPQLNEYNNLIKIYEDGTWEKSYSNIDDYTIAVSTAKGNLEPIFNPIYPVGGKYNYIYLNYLLEGNNINLIELSNKINSQVTSVQSQTLSGGSNVNISSIISRPSAVNIVSDITKLQEQYNSTVDAAYELSNLINGIETNVARVFFTLDNSNFNINGIALGINAALSYNRIYNGNIEVPLVGQGNVNNQPTIRYTKNVLPLIECGNINFMKTTAYLYRDTVFTDISNIVLSNIPYNSNDGAVIVDKILGFTQINSNTCGYTWVETQYDDFTNKPVKRNTVNIRIPYDYDNSEYQNSRIVFSNNPTIMNYSSNVYPFGNLNGWIDRWASEKVLLIQNDINENNSKITLINNRLSNLQARSNIIYNFSNTVGWNKYYNVTRIQQADVRMSPQSLLVGGFYSPQSTDINTYLMNNFSNKTYFEIYDDNQEWFRNNTIATSIIGRPFYDSIPRTEIVTRIQEYPILSQIRGLRPDYMRLGQMQINPVYGQIYRINKTNLNNYFSLPGVTYLYAIRPEYATHQSPFIWGNILEVIDSDDIYKFVEDTRIEYVQKSQEKTDILSIITNLRSELDTLPNTVINMKNSQTTNPIIQDFITNNLVTIPRYLSDIDNRLGDADGACPALRCENPTVMTQLMEQFNNDSNNDSKILKILNAYTVNPYQCDYKVITTPSLSNINRFNTNIQTLQSQVTVLQNQINTLVRQDQEKPNSLDLRRDFDNYRNNVYIPQLDNIYNNTSMPSNYPVNTRLASIIGQYTTQGWVKYMIKKYVSQFYIDFISGNAYDIFANNYYYNYVREELLLPLLSNVAEDYPYPNINEGYKLPLNLNVDASFFNIRSNYIQKRNLAYNPQITVLAKQREILNSNIREQQRLIENDRSPIVYKSFELGVDVRNCEYFYGSVSNAGYFVKENQQPVTVPNNRSNDTGFFFTSAVFNTFMTDVANTINPLIASAAANSSNMYNAILNQRSDTYDALGKLNTITFANAPSLNSSNILNMLRNNPRFINNIYLTFPRDTYLTSIKGFGITNSNTLQLLIDNTNIIRSETEEFIEYNVWSQQIIRRVTTMLPVPIFAQTRTELLNYKIEVTDNFLDYTPYYLNTESLEYITKDYVLNMSNIMPYVNGSNNTITNRIQLSNYVKLIQGSNNYSWIPESPPIEWFNSNIFTKTLNTLGYVPEDIESFSFLQNSIEFNIKTTENLPFSKKNFKLTAVFSPEQKAEYYSARNNVINDEVFYTNLMNTILSNYSYIYSEGNVRTSLRNFIGNLYDQNLMDTFRNTFNSLNLLSNGTVYSETIGKIYEAQFDYSQPNTLLYKCSLLFKDNANNYDPTRVPFDILFNNPKYYRVKFIYSAERRTYLLENYSDITYMYFGPFSTSVFTGYVVNDSNGINTDINFYIRLLSYRKIKLIPLIPLGTQFNQTDYQILSIEFYKNNDKLSETLLSIDSYPHTTLIPNDIYWVDTFNRLTKLITYSRVLTEPTNSYDNNTPSYVTSYPYAYNTSITISFGTPTSIDAFSFVTGDQPNKSIRRWILQGSVDGNTFFNIYSQLSNYNYPNNSQYYRTQKISLNTSIANTDLPQYVINITVYRISECPSFDPISKELVKSLIESIRNFANRQITYNTETFYVNSIKPITILGYLINNNDSAIVYFLKLVLNNGAGTSFNVYLKNTRILSPILNCNNIWFLNDTNSYSDIIMVSDTTNLEPSFSGYTYNLTGFTILNTACGTVDTSNFPDYMIYLNGLITARHPNITTTTLRKYATRLEPAQNIYFIISCLTSWGSTTYTIWQTMYTLVNCKIVMLSSSWSTTTWTLYPTEIDAMNFFLAVDSIQSNDWITVSSGFVDYDKKYMITYLKFESKTPLLFETITLYNKSNSKVSYKIKDKSKNSIILEVSEAIFGYSFITNNSGTSPSSWTLKGSDGKVWEVIHEESYNLKGKKLYQTPIFYLDGTNSTIEQPQSFEKPEIDVKKFVSYYKQKVNSSVNPEFKKYMYSNGVYYFIFDEYDLNNNLVAKDLIVGFEVYEDKVKKVILYEDDDGNFKPFDLRDGKQKEFWNSMIGLALDFQDF